MTRGRTLLALGIAVAALASSPAANAELRWHRCAGDGHQCAELTVPLDRTGTVPGGVTLNVVRAHDQNRRLPDDGVTLLLGGEPGEAATDRLAGEYTGSELVENLLDAAPRNRVVSFDARGTGRSGLLRCRSLEEAPLGNDGREAGACAAALGPRRGFYRTSDTVEDVEALRGELGVERITIVAVGYGAYAAQRYALAYPTRVARLVLDSPVDAAGLDPLMTDSLSAARRVLGLVCRRGCGFTRDPLRDTARLAARSPVRGFFVGEDGRRRRAALAPQDLLFTLVSGDVDVFTRSDYPAAVVSALRGDTAPLFRLRRRAVTAAALPPAVASPAARAATLCEEVRFPWAWGATAAERAAAAGALMSSDLASPFGSAAVARSELMRLCRHWPTASPQAPPPPGPMPDVPTLVLAGDTLVRTPVETARRTVRRFASGRLLVAPAVFGTPLTTSNSCVDRAVERFLSGRSVARRCPGRGLLPAGRPLPSSLRELRPVSGVAGARGRVLRAVELTLSDWLGEFYSAVLGTRQTAEEPRISGGGLRGGRYSLGGREEDVFHRYEFIRGVRVSIRSPDSPQDEPALVVDGPRGLDGRLRVVDLEDEDDPLAFVVRGRLAGQPVRARLHFRSRLLGPIVEAAAR